MKTVLKSDLDKLVEIGEVEVFTPTQLKSYVEMSNDAISKSEGSRDDLYKSVVDEMRSFEPVTMWDDDTLQKSTVMVRPAQIAWDKKGDDIEKSLSGRFLDTELNRKFDRVGLHYPMVDPIEKAKKAVIGEIREWSDGKYRKTAKGWEYIKGSDPKKKGGTAASSSDASKYDDESAEDIAKIHETKGVPSFTNKDGYSVPVEKMWNEYQHLKNNGILDEEEIVDGLATNWFGGHSKDISSAVSMVLIAAENHLYGDGGYSNGQKHPGDKEIGGKEDRSTTPQVTNNDIKEINVSGVTAEYGGGMAYHVTMKDGTKHHIKMSKVDLAKVKGSGMLHADITPTMDAKEMAASLINAGYVKVEKLPEQPKKEDNKREVISGNYSTDEGMIADAIRQGLKGVDRISVKDSGIHPGNEHLVDFTFEAVDDTGKSYPINIKLDLMKIVKDQMNKS
jgi:hypothetical protein